MNKVVKPTLMLDVSKARENILRMREKAAEHGVLFRPHFKTHQSGVVGNLFRSEGVNAITVSSAGMANYFASHGWDDITIAFPLNIRELEQINHLASRIRLTVIVDNHFQASALANQLQYPVDVMIECDTGHGRTGVDVSDFEAIASLADRLNAVSAVRLKGLLTHAGQTYSARGCYEIEMIAQKAYQNMQIARQVLGDDDLLISWGDTPSCSMLENLPPFDEWRPGNFVFYDVMQYHIGACRLSQIAVALYCPVVAVYPSRNQMVVHAGAVHLSKDFIAADGDFRNFGYVVRPEALGWSDPIAGAWVSSLSQEHGVIQFLAGTPMHFKPGDLVGILPVHSCLAADAMGGYMTLEGDTIPMYWNPAF